MEFDVSSNNIRFGLTCIPSPAFSGELEMSVAAARDIPEVVSANAERHSAANRCLKAVTPCEVKTVIVFFICSNSRFQTKYKN
jgi:hypothetical protein